jgi:WD40 repeat protein
VDVDAESLRLATGGADYKARLWALPALLDPAAEADPTQSRLLATISDHLSSVNVVRFAPPGAQQRDRLATGSDDMIVRVFKRFPGEKGLHTTTHASLAPQHAWRV